VVKIGLGLPKSLLGPLCQIVILELCTCIDMAHPQHLLNSDNVSYPLWYLGSNDIDQLFVGVIIAITEGWGADILIEFAFEDIVNYCLVNCCASS